MPRLLAIGDVHGCRTALETLLNRVQPGPEDLLVTLGDYIDRGPDSRGVIETILWWRDRTQLVALQGNHEMMMHWARAGGEALVMWLLNGGDATLASYGSDLLDTVPDAHWSFMHLGKRWFETENHIFVHANIDPDMEMEEQTDEWLFWTHLTDAPRHRSGKTVICGHTPQLDGVPSHRGGIICIDTGACRGGWLTCLDVESLHYWQANEAGETREGEAVPPPGVG